MRKEIWATFFHKISTDSNPQHQNCPAGESSWCKWWRAEFLGEAEQFKHNKPPPSEAVQKVIKPIYEDLSKAELLSRCLGAETQNNNESLNSLIWTFAPKHLHSGPKVVEIATFLPVIIFNEGFKSILKTLETMGVKIGPQAKGYVQQRDSSRIDRSERRTSDVVKQARIAKREVQRELPRRRGRPIVWSRHSRLTNYGPKCNFKKRRLRPGSFDGFPCKTKFLQERLSEHEILRDFQTIEQCSLEYTRERGASIDPHIDDCWIWGERIVTVNVIGDSVLTMTRYNGTPKRYNLEDVPTYPRVVEPAKLRPELAQAPDDCVVRLPMPARSLMVVYGPARYDWEHAVLREDIDSRRVCVAYREFTPPYLTEGDKNHEAKEILEKAQNFW